MKLVNWVSKRKRDKEWLLSLDAGDRIMIIKLIGCYDMLRLLYVRDLVPEELIDTTRVVLDQYKID